MSQAGAFIHPGLLNATDSATSATTTGRDNAMGHHMPLDHAESTLETEEGQRQIAQHLGFQLDDAGIKNCDKMSPIDGVKLVPEDAGETLQQNHSSTPVEASTLIPSKRAGSGGKRTR